jgi:hypothetical protein
MDYVRKCTSVLHPLITTGDTNGIPTAERALDDLLAATPAEHRKTSLDSVQSAVHAHREANSGYHQLCIADAVNNYIEKLMRALE